MNDFGLTISEPIQLQFIFINVIVGAISALSISWHYEKYSQIISNKGSMKMVFYFIVLVTTLVISIVKSSLALSLGLVGALSIVRFRTPVKEPEDLAYLFLCIAVGLGLGASQTISTVVSLVAILAVISGVHYAKGNARERTLYLLIDVDSEGDPGGVIGRLRDVISPYVKSAEPKRLEARDGKVFFTYLANVIKEEDMGKLTKSINDAFKSANVTLIDNTQDLNW